MRVLILTQAIDTQDPFLSFFHTWARGFSKQFQQVHIVCLKKGEYDLPANVTVYSLGKESGKLRLTYIRRFFSLVWTLRNEYDAVFVHQNQEYMLLGGWLWKVLGKPAYLWRNHYAGTIWTDIAASFAQKVFCTSRFSYTAKYPKTVLMPVGIDTDFFRPDHSINRIPSSVLFYARMAPSKNPHILINALELLAKRGIEFTATIRGTPLPKDEGYGNSLKESVQKKGLTQIHFEPGRPHAEGPAIFSTADIYVNLGDSGMYDKTIFEAAACGALVLACSLDYAELVEQDLTFEAGGARDLASKLETLLALPADEKREKASKLRSVVEQKHSLRALTESLAGQMSGH